MTVEGIESEEQFEFFRGMDFIALQGFLFSPALPADEFVAYVEQHENNDTSSQAIRAS